MGEVSRFSVEKIHPQWTVISTSGDTAPHPTHSFPVCNMALYRAKRPHKIKKDTETACTQIPTLQAGSLGSYQTFVCLISPVCKVKITTVHLTYMATQLGHKYYLKHCLGNRKHQQCWLRPTAAGSKRSPTPSEPLPHWRTQNYPSHRM